MTNRERIAALEARIAQLEARLARLEDPRREVQPVPAVWPKAPGFPHENPWWYYQVWCSTSPELKGQ
jgi:hypothetical protein